MKAKSNYEIMRDRMQLQFLEYDQRYMIDKFHLEHDGDYLYIQFVRRPYRIHRGSGRVEWSEDAFKSCTVAGYNEAMSIFDVLCCSKDDCRLSGRFCNIGQRKGASSPGGGSVFYHQIRALDGRTESFRRACALLGGEPEGPGDIAYRLHPFDFLPMILQFWNSDEEFPASLNVMWDENVLDYVHYETTYFIVSHVLTRICEIMCGLDDMTK